MCLIWWTLCVWGLSICFVFVVILFFRCRVLFVRCTSCVFCILCGFLILIFWVLRYECRVLNYESWCSICCCSWLRSVWFDVWCVTVGVCVVMVRFPMLDCLVVELWCTMCVFCFHSWFAVYDVWFLCLGCLFLNFGCVVLDLDLGFSNIRFG